MKQETPKEIDFRGFAFPSKEKLSFAKRSDLKQAVGSKLWEKLQKSKLLSIIDFYKEKGGFKLYKITYNGYDNVTIEAI